MSRLCIGVLMGGKSVEREVSLNSGRTVCDHLDTSCYDVIPIFQMQDGSLYRLPWSFLHRGKTSDFEHRLAGEAERLTWDKLPSLIDLMYIAQHGRYGEDGCVQGFLELLGIPYVGSKVFASALGMHKAIQKQFLQSAGIEVPRGIIVHHAQLEHIDIQRLITPLVFPLIVKPVAEGSSYGVSKVHNSQELFYALKKAAYVNPHKPQDVIIEEFLVGMEFSCIVIADTETGLWKALPATEIVLEERKDIFDYEQKYMPGRATKHTPAHCSAEEMALIQSTAVRACQALDFATLGRIDGFLTKDHRVVITDPNSFSGMSPSSYAFLQAAEIGMNHTEFINSLIVAELRQYNLENPSKSLMVNDIKHTVESKKRVAVLLGGASNEREISLESGRNVIYKLSPHKYEVTPLFVSDSFELYAIPPRLLVRNKTAEIQAEVNNEMKVLWNDLPQRFDFVFIALHGGAGENGCIQGTLEMLGIPYNGSSVLASGLCMDKYKTNEFLETQGFAIPRHYLIDKNELEEDIDRIEAVFGFPLIIKPHDDGCSVMVQKAHNQKELRAACMHIFNNGKQKALVEECIVGTELTVGVIGNDTPRALPPSQSIAAGGILSIEEKFLPGAGENQTPALLPAAAISLVQVTMERVYKAVGCVGYARIDCFYQTAEQSPTGHERVVIIEINSLPGLTPATCLFHQAAEIGIKPMDFIDLIVQLGLEKHGVKEGASDILTMIMPSIVDEIQEEKV